jgi:hypothetical protein
MRQAALLALLLLFPSLGRAQTCAQRLDALKKSVEERYALENLRGATQNVNARLSAVERARIAELAVKFKEIRRAGGPITDLFPLQREADRIVRAATARAGYPVLNPETGSPYVAVIYEKPSDDEIGDYTVEVRALLIRPDPRPHTTVRIERYDPAHNPRLITEIGIMPDSRDDYASWREPVTYRSVSGTLAQFLASLLPAECR